MEGGQLILDLVVIPALDVTRTTNNPKVGVPEVRSDRFKDKKG